MRAPIVNGGGDSCWRRPYFQLSRASYLNLDRVILHTVVHHSSASTDMPNFIEIEETFCGPTDVRTNGRTFETHFIRLTWRSRPKRKSRLKVQLRVRRNSVLTIRVIVMLEKLEESGIRNRSKERSSKGQWNVWVVENGSSWNSVYGSDGCLAWQSCSVNAYVTSGLFRSTPPSQPNKVDLQCPSARPSVRKKSLRFQWNLVCR